MQPQSWTSHPLKEEPPQKSILLILIILSISTIVHISFASGIFAFLSAILLTTAMSRYFLPTHYTIDTKFLTISHLGTNRQHPWTNFRRAVCHPDGIFLSPFTPPHRLDAFRGQFVRTPNSDEVYHVIQQHINTESD
ncbi:MAG: hypothetical protein QGG64_08935 [Candidatus Latescibacteria bacterium]|nr:hypothetical protein [Candidatus Latescibacterota bacterium]